MKKNKILTGIFVAGCVAVIGVAGIVTMFAKDNFGNKDLICNGVSVGSVNVGGLTQKQAQKKISEYIEDREQQQLVINIRDDQVQAAASEIGFTIKRDEYAAQALAIGKKGNLWKRFQEIRKAEQGEKDIDMEEVIDDEAVQKFVQTKCTVYDIKAKNSRLKFKNGELKATKSSEGLEVQVDQTVQNIKKAFRNKKIKGRDVLNVEADVEVTEPDLTQEEASQCTDLLGKYSTTYATYQVERSGNVATAAGRINGTVLKPGQTFSTIKVIKDRTEANGYKPAPEYSSGKVVSGIGGGVCQVSTTLYNAVLNAELKVVERSPHSMVVHYVPVSRDAAISGDYKDFKFKNNTEYPVYIMGSASGGVLSFRIYGHETREAGREISFESEVTDTIQPGKEVVTEDPSQPASYRTVTQSAHVGYKAKLWKIIKVNGVQTKKKIVNTSAYNASPQYVTVGKQPATAAPSSEKPSASGKPSPTDKSSSKKTAGDDASAAKATGTGKTDSQTKKDTGTKTTGSQIKKSTGKKTTGSQTKKSTGTKTTGSQTNKSTEVKTAGSRAKKSTGTKTTGSQTKKSTGTRQ